MDRHLNDMDFALLLSGDDDAALDPIALAHLDRCATCRQELSDLAALPGRPISVGETPGQELTARLQALLSGPVNSRIVPLRTVSFRAALADHGRVGPLVGAEVGDALLAADGDGGEDLPVLYSQEPEVLVRFRRLPEGKGVRAYVLAHSARSGRLRVHIADRELSVPVTRAGTADLPELSEEELRSSRIEIELMECPHPGAEPGPSE